jgi:GxxExxY protein
MTENELAKIIVNIAFQIHTKIGPGLLESVYEEIMVHELMSLNLLVERQKPIAVYWNDLKNGCRISG